jgi:hypothetical protein
MGLQKQVDEQRLDHRRIVADLVIAGRQRPAQLEPVQRRLAGHRSAIIAPGFQLAGQDRHHRVVPELVVIDQVLIAQRHSEHPLPDQRLDRVLDQLLPTGVAETGREAANQSDRPVRRPKQQRSSVRSDASAVERRHHRTAFNRYKSKQIRHTVRLHRGAPRVQLSF